MNLFLFILIGLAGMIFGGAVVAVYLLLCFHRQDAATLSRVIAEEAGARARWQTSCENNYKLAMDRAEVIHALNREIVRLQLSQHDDPPEEGEGWKRGLN